MRFVFKTHYDQDLGLFKHTQHRVCYALLGAIMVALPWLISDYLLGEFTLVLIWSIAGMGLMILIGQTGQASLGHAAFLAIGASSSPKPGPVASVDSLRRTSTFSATPSTSTSTRPTSTS